MALVVLDDERGEIFYLDSPDRFHSGFGIFQHLDLADAVLCQPCRGSADRAEVKAAMASREPLTAFDRLPLASMTSDAPAARKSVT